MEVKTKLDETGQDVFGDLDDESELLKNSLFMFVSTILKAMGQSFWQSYFITEEYIVSEPDPTMERPNNFVYLDYFHSLPSGRKLSGTQA